ncbi:hypothetical protein AB9F39_39565, partial [Rhizobium leguminosarum]|uniref:hypothetical protein n=1 Tax=Rhizobium leguminosarum TaxID=384 RepID=UPI003F9CAE9A
AQVLRYAAGAQSIFALRQEYHRPPKSPNSFLDMGFAAVSPFRGSTDFFQNSYLQFSVFWL